MSELATFNEGYIFDGSNNNDIDSQFVIRGNKPCLIYLNADSTSDTWTIQIHRYKNNQYYKTISDNSVDYGKTNIYTNTDFINLNVEPKPTIIIWNDIKYLFIPMDTLNDGMDYKISVNRYVDYGKLEKSSEYFIQYVFSLPIINFVNYTYEDNSGIHSGDISIDNGFHSVTLPHPVCTIHCIYSQYENDILKNYQFTLYNSKGEVIGGTEKIFKSSSPTFVCENLNNNSQYILQFCCISQSGNIVYSDNLQITTNYKQSSLYSDIIFGLDEISAENRITVSIVEFTGTTDDDDNPLTYIDDEKVQISGERFVNFKDKYNLITHNFLIRIWLEDIVSNANILTLYNDRYSIVVKYYDNRFHAFKYSCGLISHYISDEIIPNNTLYFALGYYNHRLEIYAQNLTT